MIIINGRIITWGSPNQIFYDKALLIRDGIIQKIDNVERIVSEFPEEEIVDALQQLVMPGNICAHTHFYGAFARGMAIPGNPPADFYAILKQLWWNLDKALDYEAIKYSVLVCLIDAIKHGTTTLFDHHASPNAIEGSLDVIAEAVINSGLRASLCYEVTDRDGEKMADYGTQENSRFIKRISNKSSKDKLLRAHFGLHASLTLSNKTLEKCRLECPEKIGFHVHSAEGIVDQEDSLNQYGKRVIERFADFGMLRDSSIMVHGVHLDEHEIDLLRDTETWLTHQPRSNMNNAVGVAPIENMLAKGVKVGMGNDGFSNSMWEEWKAAYLLHKVNSLDPAAMNGFDILKMAVQNNAELASMTFDGLRIGEITTGAAADLIFVDYHEYTPLHEGNLPWHILFGFRESMVTTTIVAGEILMRNRILTTLDEVEINKRALEVAIKTWKKVNN